jgi:hypothetical protein
MTIARWLVDNAAALDSVEHRLMGFNRQITRTERSATHSRAGLRRMLMSAVIALTVPLLGPVHPAAAATPSEVPVLSNPDIDETNAASAPGHLAWDQAARAHPTHFDVDTRINGTIVRLNAAGTQGLGGGIDGDTMVLEQVIGADHNIVLYHFATRKRTGISALNTWSGAQSHPTISGPWILLQRHRSNGSSWVVLYNRDTRRIRTIAHRVKPRRFVYAGQVNGNYAVWGLSTPSAWDVYLYDIAKSTSSLIPRPKGVSFQYMPAVTPDGTVYYSRGDNGCGQNVRIMRRGPGGQTTRLVHLPDLADTGYMYASRSPNGSTTLYFNRASCLDRADYDVHPWDIYKIEGAEG